MKCQFKCTHLTYTPSTKECRGHNRMYIDAGNTAQAAGTTTYVFEWQGRKFISLFIIQYRVDTMHVVVPVKVWVPLAFWKQRKLRGYNTVF